MIFKIAVCLRDRHVFMWQLVEILNVFINFETDFLENRNLFKKLEQRFLVESTKIENASLPYKTAWSKANVDTNRMVSTKWTYHKVLPVTSLFFWKFCFSLRNSYKELIWCTNDPNANIRVFVSAGILFDGAFSPWVSLIWLARLIWNCFFMDWFCYNLIVLIK